MKFLMNVGAEKAGTTWFWKYFDDHPDFFSLGKELNIIERDNFVPTLSKTSKYKKDINVFFNDVKSLKKVTGDFTHYEGSSENIYRIYKEGLNGIDIIPVYIMRDPIQRAWSSWNMFYKLTESNRRLAWQKIDPMKSLILEKSNYSSRFDFNHHAVSDLFISSWLAPKYLQTIKCLDSVFDSPIYLFYENLFNQKTMNLVCDALEISHKDIDKIKINSSSYNDNPPKEFVDKYCDNVFYKNTVDYIKNRFYDVEWKYDYT